MIRSLKGYARLSQHERELTAKVLGLALVVDVGLRVMEFPSLVRALGLSLTGRAGEQPGSIGPDTDLLVRGVDRVLQRWPPGGRCLRRSLVLGYLLRRHGPVIRIGVARDGAAVAAHAWVEVCGHPVGEKVDPSLVFSPLAES